MEKIELKLKSLSRVEQFSLENLKLICQESDYKIFGYSQTDSSNLIKISFLIDFFYMDDIIDLYGLQYTYFFDRNAKIKNFFFDKKSGELIQKEILLRHINDDTFAAKFFAKKVNFFEDEYLNDELDFLDYANSRPKSKFIKKKFILNDRESSSEDKENDENLDEDNDQLSLLLFKKGKKLYKEKFYQDALQRFNLAFYKCSVGYKYEFLYLWWWAACLFKLKDYGKSVIIYYKALHRMDNEKDIEMCKRQIDCAIRRRERIVNELKIKNIFNF